MPHVRNFGGRGAVPPYRVSCADRMPWPGFPIISLVSGVSCFLVVQSTKPVSSVRRLLSSFALNQRKHSICTVANGVDAREDRLLANGIDVRERRQQGSYVPR